MRVVLVSANRLLGDLLVLALHKRQIVTVVAEPHPPDDHLSTGAVILWDADQPPAELTSALDALRARAPHPRLVLLAAPGQPGMADLARLFGAAGCVTHEHDVDELAKTLREVAAGTPVRPVVPSRPQGAPGASLLTGREIEILELVAAGQSDLAVATGLNISVHTVRSHLQSARAKLGVPNRFAAVATARSAGLLRTALHNGRPAPSPGPGRAHE